MFLCDDSTIDFTVQPGLGAPVWCGRAANRETLKDFAAAARQVGGRVAAIWGSDERRHGGGFRLHCVFGLDRGHAWVSLDLPADDPVYPDLSGIFPTAGRMQRATHDLVGIASAGGDQRPWLRHGAWPADWYPLRHDAVHEAGMGAGFPNFPSDYEFVKVGGEGAHEIPVGPIHAGIIEPGHFRFSVVGERVLRLEQRLGYQHKGVEKLFIGADIARGARLVGRVSGDSTCAYAWAYAAAVEAACRVEPPPRALAVRALLLERERVANHLGDLGMLGNDAAFAFGLTQFFRLKEDWVRLNASLFGHRFMMDCIVPGGVAVDPDAAALAAIVEQCGAIEAAVKELRELYDGHPGLQDRFATTGIIDSNLARELSLTGMAARATGILLDGRAHRQGYTPPPPYAALGVRPVTDERGDVAARVAVRFDEIAESLRLLRILAVGMAAGDIRVDLAPPAGGSGLGVIEGWRGEVLVGVQFDNDGRLARVHPHDPSWQAWPALEHAVMNDIVPDFPLINKSFNLSYSGVDPVIPLLRHIFRTGILTEPPQPAGADDPRREIDRLHDEILHVLGRALTIREVDAGSCNGCELEVHALNNPYYNLEGRGIKFVASPRHADMLLVTGPVTKNMENALRIAYDCTPDPKLVVAVGDCGCNGGVFGESYASCGAIGNVVGVDVRIPGCPPTPLALMQGILAAVRTAK